MFFANHVQLIREITSTHQWYYVNTSENPADHVSRGLLVSDISSTNWMSAHTFLWGKKCVHLLIPQIIYSWEILKSD